ncbi:MAG: hypothetical protein IPG97_15955 [Microthrixaceae bacterium]|nr:hypothetical protein [Microthrixaceae bacterium]MBK6857989.1 hypothetical protein [Microthrixaceae bacterium]
MKRTTKRRLSTVIGCVLGGVTFTGPLAGAVLSDWQCRRGAVCEAQTDRWMTAGLSTERCDRPVVEVES